MAACLCAGLSEDQLADIQSVLEALFTSYSSQYGQFVDSLPQQVMPV